MKIFTWLSTLMAVCLQTQAAVIHADLAEERCDRNWIQQKGRCYFVTSGMNKMTWELAHQVCPPYRAGAFLAQEDSPDVSDYFRDLMLYTRQSYWIDLADTNGTATFDTWSDGTPLTHSRWREGRPSGVNGTCVVTTLSGWVDTDCESFYPIICQYNLPLPPVRTEAPTMQMPSTTTTSSPDVDPPVYISNFGNDDVLTTPASGAVQWLLSASLLYAVIPVLMLHLITL